MRAAVTDAGSHDNAKAERGGRGPETMIAAITRSVIPVTSVTPPHMVADGVVAVDGSMMMPRHMTASKTALAPQALVAVGFYSLDIGHSRCSPLWNRYGAGRKHRADNNGTAQG